VLCLTHSSSSTFDKIKRNSYQSITVHKANGSYVGLLPGGAYHAGAATVWWPDSDAAGRPTPEYNDFERAAGTQFQLTADELPIVN